ncbi:hypothetical protein [Piscinibacter sp. XHJ-5]|uniref:hypothetical protein n=1 Tax=Piscinibacter sp. XHJ-5 TaxID=3037797 RepID=UPI0024530672|nr:hypothetical protein [Piscinibacter sp. XHJ-5]
MKLITAKVFHGVWPTSIGRSAALPLVVAMAALAACGGGGSDVAEPASTESTSRTVQAAAVTGGIQIALQPDNVIGAGYNAETHRYEASFIRSTLTAPTHRKMIADVCSFGETVSVEVETADEAKPCNVRTLSVRTLPQGVSSLVLALTGPHPVLPGGSIEIEKFTVVTEAFRGDGTCIPKNRNRPPVRKVTDCRHSFSVPLPSNPLGLAEHAIKAEAFSGTSVVQTASVPVKVPKRVPLIVSVGDSYASGEGNPDRPGASLAGSVFYGQNCFTDTSQMYKFDRKPEMARKPVWYDARDHRSLKSAPALAAKKIQKDWPYAVFLSFAKSGAKVDGIVEQLRQVRETVGDHRIDALLVSAGGNDAGFADILAALTTNIFGGAQPLNSFMEKLLQLRDAEYPKLAPALDGLQIGHVLMTEYPGRLFNNASGQPAHGCEVFEDATTGVFDVTAQEAGYFNTMGDLLNSEIGILVERRNAALRQLGQPANWRRIGGLAELFDRHGYCSTAVKYYRWAEDSCDQQGDFDGTMHPNEAGSAAIANEIEKELRLVMPDLREGTVK